MEFPTCLESRAPLELAYIVPFTSQIVAFIAIWQASRGLPERPSKHLAGYLFTTGLVFSLISLLVLGLSLARLRPVRALHTELDDRLAAH